MRVEVAEQNPSLIVFSLLSVYMIFSYQKRDVSGIYRAVFTVSVNYDLTGQEMSLALVIVLSLLSV